MIQKITIAKADFIKEPDEVADAIIEINGKILYFEAMEAQANFYDTEAEKIANLLYNTLPQATFDRLIIKLMEKKVSIYRGKTCW